MSILTALHLGSSIRQCMNAIIDFLRDLALSFIPLFVAVDAIGILPFILALTQEETVAERNRVLRYAMFTAFALGLGFIIVGDIKIIIILLRFLYEVTLKRLPKIGILDNIGVPT